MENIPEFTDTPAESFSHDTRAPEFYKGMSDTIDKMQNGDEPLSKAMSTAIKNGELSAEQATVMNGRYSELRAEGHSMNETLEIMKKDYILPNLENARKRDKQVSDTIIFNIDEKYINKLFNLTGTST